MRVALRARLSPGRLLVLMLAFFLFASLSRAGAIVSDGVPYISEVSPISVVPGGSDFTLTVSGFNFASDATVYWGSTVLTTTYASSDSLTATVPASLVAAGGTGWITVKNGSVTVKSNLAFVSVAHPITNLTMAQSTLGTGSDPLELAEGDFNNDGKLDLAATNYGDGTFSVMLGNGDGTFQDAQSYSTSAEPFGLAIGDVNGDGNLDIVVGNDYYGSGNVTVSLGNGDGTFQSAVPLPGTSNESLHPMLADFNRDGTLDVLVGSNSGSGAQLFLGNGDGTFQSPVSVGSSAYAFSEAIGDVNGDGNVDVILDSNSESEVDVYLGNGDGTFQSPTAVGTSTYLDFLQLHDVNGDGKLDLIGCITGDSSIYVFLGNGDGTFQTAESITVSSVYNFAVGDLNGDGKLDIAAAGYNQMQVLLGNGDGTYQDPISFPDGSFCYGPVIGNFASGGSMAIAVTDFSGNQVFVFQQTLAVSPSSVDFGNQGAGSTSSAQPVILTNSTSSTVNISSIDFAGTNAGDFAQTNDCGTSLTSGSTCTIQVTFTPGAQGSRSATLSVTDDAPASPQSVALTGTGAAAPIVELSSQSVAFTDQHVGTAASPQQVTLTNSGSAALSLSGFSITGTNATDFSETTDCGSSLDPAASCTLTLDFTPAASGARSASLEIADGAAGSPHVISLTGVGTQAEAQLSTNSVDFGSSSIGTAAATQHVTLTNNGNEALAITGISVTGTNAADFTQTNNCGTSVAASASCTIDVVMTPSAKGSRSASLEIADNAAGTPHVVTLSGTGTQAEAQLSASSVDFGASNVGTAAATQHVTLTNSGNQALTISGISVTGTNATDFAQTNNCGTSVTASGSCTIDVVMTPSAEGTRTASLTISDNASGSPQTVSLTGVGSQGIGQLSTTSLALGGSNVGTAAAVQHVTFSNTGNASLAISGIGITGTNAGDFAQTNDCGTSLTAGANCTINVTMTPSAGGDRSANLAITTNASGTQMVALSGAGRDFALSFMSSSQSVAPGGSATFQLGVSPMGGFNQAITISCSGAPAQSACSIQPGSVTPDGTSTATVAVMVATTAKSFVPPAAPRGNFPGTKPMMWLVSLCLLALTFFSARRTGAQAFRLAPAATLVLVVALLALGMSACNAGVSQPLSGGTPAGSYTLTVTATSGGLSHTSTAQLTVQ